MNPGFTSSDLQSASLALKIGRYASLIKATDIYSRASQSWQVIGYGDERWTKDAANVPGDHQTGDQTLHIPFQ